MLAISGLSLACLLTWGIPTFCIAYEEFIPKKERKLWIIANLFFPWAAYFAFLLIAPVTSAEED